MCFVKFLDSSKLGVITKDISRDLKSETKLKQNNKIQEKNKDKNN